MSPIYFTCLNRANAKSWSKKTNEKQVKFVIWMKADFQSSERGARRQKSQVEVIANG